MEDTNKFIQATLKYIGVVILLGLLFLFAYAFLDLKNGGGWSLVVFYAVLLLYITILLSQTMKYVHQQKMVSLQNQREKDSADAERLDYIVQKLSTPKEVVEVKHSEAYKAVQKDLKALSDEFDKIRKAEETATDKEAIKLLIDNLSKSLEEF